MKSVEQLKAIFDDSKRQAGGIVFYRDDGTVRGVHRTTPGSANSFSLRQLQTAAKASAEYGLTIDEQKAQKEIPVSAAIAERSRVASAGAHILVVDPAAEAKPVGEGTGVLAFSYVSREFVTIAPAPFAPIPEPAPEVSESASPISRIKFGYHGGATQGFAGPSYAVRFKLQRAETKEVHGGQDRILGELLQSITMGLARAADHALLSAIVASTPAPFTLAAAAAAGLEFSQLRALVGTNAAAAAVGQDGTLRAAGVPAELTSEMASTLVGSFGSVGVAVHDSLRIHVLQTGLNGDALVTCWADFQPLLPEQPFLWTAA